MMDLFDWMLSWGNLSVMNYWKTIFGWGYIAVKFVFYASIAYAIGHYIFQKKRYLYKVDIETVGPEKTIIESHDWARYKEDGAKIYLRKLRISITAPDKKFITPVIGTRFIRGKIRLYRYGQSSYSYTPIEPTLKGESVDYAPIEPKLSVIKALFEQAERKFNTKSLFIQYLPLIMSMMFVVVCFILLLVAINQMKPLIDTGAQMVDKAGLILDRFNQCQVSTGVAPF
jgi:hypothetical protein